VVGVLVDFFEPGLVQMRMRVLSPVMVGMGVFVLDVLVLVIGVRMRVLDTAVLVVVRMRILVGVLFGHLRSSPFLETFCLIRRFDYPQPVVTTVMPGNFRPGVLGVVNGVDDELPNMVVLQAVEDRGAFATGLHQSRHPQLGQVLGHRRRRFAHMLREFVDRHLAVGQRPQHLHAGGVGEHSEHLDDQADLIVGQPNLFITCMHTQILRHTRQTRNN
jgi:hypothetical protein